MATNSPMPGPTYVANYARFYGELLTSASAVRFNAASLAEAETLAPNWCPPGWKVTGVRKADLNDKQPRVN